MSAPQTTSGPPARTAPATPGGFWAGRSGLVMPLVLVAFSLYLIIGSMTLDVEDADFPGPGFFPALIGTAGLVLAAVIAVGLLRHPEPVPGRDGETTRFHSDVASLGWTVLGFAAFAVLLPWLGWILGSALLFWCVAHGFGSRRPVFDVLVALFMGSVAYLAFDVALGLNLPSGLLGGGF
ncbi:MAG TPA: tripartite tricarboxylate transporter TctB family protein [Citricoccus sp.]